MARKTKTDPELGRLAPDDACPTCGTVMDRKCGPYKLSVNGERVRVKSMPHWKCPKCGESMFSVKDALQHMPEAIAAYRGKYDLLSADEIRGIRDKFGLTQAELSDLLQLGANTISRWESGRNVQSAAMDKLLRIIRDLPGTIEYLRTTAA